MPRVLLVEDTYSLAESYRACLKDKSLIIETVVSMSEARDRLAQALPDLVLLDVHLPDGSGLDILRDIRQRDPHAEVIVFTGQASINLAVEAMRDGASDFLIKPFSIERLRDTVDAALERRRAHQRQVESFVEARVRPADTAFAIPRAMLDAQLKASTAEPVDRFGNFIGRSPAMQAVYRVIRKAAPSTATVFVTGESGTGKELCADALHSFGTRRHGPFVTINCAAIPRDLLESEIFGHVKGAFTGASADRKGAVLQAHGGTLFLDEICEMDLGLQAKMLRFLQQKTVQRVGEDVPRPADVRIVCATNRDPVAEVAAGRFREDLFYRLHVVPIDMPELRERGTDILLIAKHALQQFSLEDGKSLAVFDPAVEDAFLRYAWPGNVRQLLNVIRNIVVLNDGERVDLTMLPRHIAEGSPSEREPLSLTLQPERLNDAEPQAVVPLDHVIRLTIEAAVAACGGSVPKAAAALEVSPSTLYRRIQGWDEPTVSTASVK